MWDEKQGNEIAVFQPSTTISLFYWFAKGISFFKDPLTLLFF